jgi:phage terminase large subunit-like protein
MAERGIPLPTCPPKFKTPEPRRLAGARFDPAAVDRVLAAFEMCRHTKGVWAGRPLRPDPWQVAYILAPVYGWVRRNSAGMWVRIARTEYVELPRKNGKTTLAGGQALYLTGGDGEPGAEVYAAAAGKDQAGFCFEPIKALAEGAPGLKQHFRTVTGKVIHRRTLSYFRVVSSIGDLMHGANVHGAIVDELHIHKTRDLVDAIETGVGARAQPLVIIITTADDSRQGTIYAEKRHLVEQLARRTITDPSVYGVIWAADDIDAQGERPFAEDTWKRANPGYGISPTREFMAAEATKARQSPANLARFLRLHLGVRTKQATKYLDLAAWDRNAGLVDEQALAGRRCFGGLDLAATADLCALAWLFPDEAGGYDVLWRHWAPEAVLESLDRRTAGQASVWVREGWLTLTPGAVTDYGRIRAQINADRERFDVSSVAYDPWNATQLVGDLESDGLTMVTVRQTYAHISAPTKEMQRLILAGTPARPMWRHGGNPLIRWQVDNFAVEMDPAGNVKPSKKAAGDKIDGLVAAVDALVPATAPADEPGAFFASWR